MMYARKCLDPFPSVGVYTSQTSLVFSPSLSHLSPFYCLIKKKWKARIETEKNSEAKREREEEKKPEGAKVVL